MVGREAIFRWRTFTTEVTRDRGIRRRLLPSTSLRGNIVVEGAGRRLVEAKDAAEEPNNRIVIC
jgi:hypothetical protein